MIHLPDSQDAVPPEAERCPDPSQPDGRCRFANRCSHQGSQQRIARFVGADVVESCPWVSGFEQRLGYEDLSEERRA